MTILFDNIVSELGWEPKDGDAPGHFREKMPGHRCLWTVNWATSQGMITPRDLITVEDMSREQMILELNDVLERGETENFQDISILLVRLKSERWEDSMGRPARILFGKMSNSNATYPEYVSFWDVPNRIFIRRWRPGWPNPDGDQPVHRWRRRDR